MVRAVEGLTRLEQLEAPVPRDVFHPRNEARLLVVREGTEGARERRRLLQVLEGREAYDLRRDRLAQRVAVALLGAQARRLHDAARMAAAVPLHADDTDVAPQALRHHLLLEAAVVRVHHVDGHLGRVPVVRLTQHLEVDGRVLVAGEADEPHLAFLLRLEPLGEHALFDDPLGVVVVIDFVELPEVDAIGAQPAQAVLEALERARVVAVAVLGHEEDLLAPSVHGQGSSHQLLGPSVVVVPGVVEERDPLVESRMHEARGLRLVRDGADVPAAEGKDGDPLPRTPEHARGKATGTGGGRLGDHLLSQGAHRGGPRCRLLQEIPARRAVGHGASVSRDVIRGGAPRTASAT